MPNNIPVKHVKISSNLLTAGQVFWFPTGDHYYVVTKVTVSKTDPMGVVHYVGFGPNAKEKTMHQLKSVFLMDAYQATKFKAAALKAAPQKWQAS